MKQVLIKSGNIVVENIPAPTVDSGCILVRVEYSCISAGTENAGLKMSGLPIYKRALKQPENVKIAIDMMRNQGIGRTIDRISGKLAGGSPTGYSAAGVVIDVGPGVTEFSIGDMVACAGAGVANHAEFICVPKNLAVRVPQNLSAKQASTVTLGAIAMQGIRRLNPTIGESVVVIGLGLIGQISAQILLANGCKVLGVDIDPSRVALSKKFGVTDAISPSEVDHLRCIDEWSGGVGADCVVITAASESHAIVSEAMQACRKKGRIVLVGDVGLNLRRADFYKKELDFFISSSYGPGRYDPIYEESGVDYPLPYVRWTENRNMKAYLDLLADSKINIDFSSVPIFEVDDAAKAYQALAGGNERPLLTLLKYSRILEKDHSRVEILPRKVAISDRINVAIIGASSFAQGMHLPNLFSLKNKYSVEAIMSRTGSNAQSVAKQYGASYCTTDYKDILRDENIDLVLISTRHNLHSQMALEALYAGKNVFVEKPLSLNEEELSQIESFYLQNPVAPLLMVGFNRRFSPAIAKVKKLIADRRSPMMINYQMNAGFIDPTHWVQTGEGGGRNIGEACHIYDLFNYLCDGVGVEEIKANSISPRSLRWKRNDNFSVSIKYEDGSLCNLMYTSMGSKDFPKERMEIYCDGAIVVMDDYKAVNSYGQIKHKWKSTKVDKGQLMELEELANFLLQGGSWPISLDDLFRATHISFEVENQIYKKESVNKNHQ